MSESLPTLARNEVREWIARHFPAQDYTGKRVLMIVPDGTRTAPLPLLFDALFQQLHGRASQIDVIFALGTHPPMNERQMCRLLGISEDERQKLFATVGLFNHEWDDPAQMLHMGRLSPDETKELSEGLLVEEVPVTINKRIAEYDVLLVVGPVFPHEVVGFSGGNKYFFPGIAGAEILNFFHWLGALITNASIIGVKNTPVRRVVDKAAAALHQARILEARHALTDCEFTHGNIYPSISGITGR